MDYNYTKTLREEIKGQDYNRKIKNMSFTKSETEEPVLAYSQLGDRSVYFNPEQNIVYDYENNLSMYQALSEDLIPCDVDISTGKGSTRKTQVISSFKGNELYFDADKAYKNTIEKANLISTLAVKERAPEEKTFLLSYSGSKKYINTFNNKSSFVVYAPLSTLEKINSLDIKKKEEGYKEFILFKQRILEFHKDVNKEIKVQKGLITGALEFEAGTIQQQENVDDHFHMVVGGYSVFEENGKRLLQPKKIKWENADDSNGYRVALENFIRNDEVLNQVIEDISTYNVLAPNVSRTAQFSMPNSSFVPNPNTGTEPSPVENPNTGPITNTGVSYQKSIKVLEDLGLKISNDLKEYNKEGISFEERTYIDKIEDRINKTNVLFSDVVNERIIPLLNANEALITSREMVIKNAHLTKLNNEYRDLLEKSSSVITGLNKDITDLNKDITDLNKNKELIEKDNELLKVKVTELFTSNEDLKSKNEILNKSHEALEIDYDSLEKNYSLSNKHKKRLTELLKNRKDKVNDLSNSLELEKKEKEDLKVSIEKIEKTHIETLEKMKEENEKILETLKEKHKTSIEEKEKEYDSAIKTLNDQISIKDSLNTQQSQVLTQQNSLMTSMTKTLKDKDSEIIKLQKDIENALKLSTTDKEKTKSFEDDLQIIAKEFFNLAKDNLSKEEFTNILSKTKNINDERIVNKYFDQKKTNNNSPKR